MVPDETLCAKVGIAVANSSQSAAATIGR